MGMQGNDPPPAPDVDEALDTIEDALAESKLSFRRYVVKLLIEKAIGPALIAAVSGGCTAAVGWYVVGRQQVTDRVEEEVELRDRVRELLEEAREAREPIRVLPPGMTGVMLQPIQPETTIDQSDDWDVDALRKMWEKKYGPADRAEARPDDATQQFPRELVQTKLDAMNAARH